nr:MAG TPA: hypothetical protein [Caudoviricetes sp.]
MYDSDNAARDCRALWLKVGRSLKAKAVERAESGLETLAVRTARLADLCFWQATGEGDVTSMSDIFPKREDA